MTEAQARWKLMAFKDEDFEVEDYSAENFYKAPAGSDEHTPVLISTGPNGKDADEAAYITCT